MLYLAYMTFTFLQGVFHGVGIAFYRVGNVFEFICNRVALRIEKKIGPPAPQPATLVQTSTSTPATDLN
jgi:hypothetical protein